MATSALLLVLLATLVLLGRPPGRLTVGAVPAAALRGALVLSRLSDRRRERLRGAPPYRPEAGHGVVAQGPRSAGPLSRATTP